MIEVAKDEAGSLTDFGTSQHGGAEKGHASGGRGQHANAPTTRSIDTENVNNSTAMRDSAVANAALLHGGQIHGKGSGGASSDRTGHERVPWGPPDKLDTKARETSATPVLGLRAAPVLLHRQNPGGGEGGSGHGRMLDSGDVGRPDGSDPLHRSRI